MIDDFITLLKDLANNWGLALGDLSDTQLQDLMVYSNKLYYSVSREVGDRQSNQEQPTTSEEQTCESCWNCPATAYHEEGQL